MFGGSNDNKGAPRVHFVIRSNSTEELDLAGKYFYNNFRGKKNIKISCEKMQEHNYPTKVMIL